MLPYIDLIDYQIKN